MAFQVKDSGKREEYKSGMVRDTQDGKIDYDRVFDGVLVDRLAEHLTKAQEKYKDQPDGTPNWLLADGPAELIRFRKSAARHFRQWLRGDQDEDHFAAVVFNLNAFETLKAKLAGPKWSIAIVRGRVVAGLKMHKDEGGLWCMCKDNFRNLQEDPAGFGSTPEEAFNSLIEEQKRGNLRSRA